jgi:aconitase A
VHFTIDYSHFKIIYGFNPLTNLGLFPLHIDERVNLDGNRKTHIVKALRENMRHKIQQNNEQYEFKDNKRQKMIIF